MKRLVGGKQFCSKDGCPKSFPNHQWGKYQATQEGWLIQRNGDAWCPEHFPDWVAEWRAKKKLQGE